MNNLVRIYEIRKRKSVQNISATHLLLLNYCSDDSNDNESANCGVADLFFSFLSLKRKKEEENQMKID